MPTVPAGSSQTRKHGSELNSVCRTLAASETAAPLFGKDCLKRVCSWKPHGIFHRENPESHCSKEQTLGIPSQPSIYPQLSTTRQVPVYFGSTFLLFEASAPQSPVIFPKHVALGTVSKEITFNQKEQFGCRKIHVSGHRDALRVNLVSGKIRENEGGFQVPKNQEVEGSGAVSGSGLVGTQTQQNSLARGVGLLWIRMRRTHFLLVREAGNEGMTLIHQRLWFPGIPYRASQLFD